MPRLFPIPPNHPRSARIAFRLNPLCHALLKFSLGASAGLASCRWYPCEAKGPGWSVSPSSSLDSWTVASLVALPAFPAE